MRILIFVFCLLFPVVINADTIALPTTATPIQGAGISNRDANYTVSPPATTGDTNSSSQWQAYLPGRIDPKWRQDANWITPTANGVANLGGGDWTFTLSFDLPDSFAAGLLTGTFYADDYAYIVLNGVKVTPWLPTGASGYWANSLQSFTASGLRAGTNTISFVVRNDPTNTPVGLAVQSLTASTATVPEPGTLLLLCSGLLGAVGLRRRKS